MTITIHTYQEDSKIQLAINYLKQIGLSFTIDNEEVDEEMLKERECVRQQIHRKYVLLGQWNQFDDDEKQDIVLAETMIYRQQQTNRSALSSQEASIFLTQLAQGTYGN